MPRIMLNPYLSLNLVQNVQLSHNSLTSLSQIVEHLLPFPSTSIVTNFNPSIVFTPPIFDGHSFSPLTEGTLKKVYGEWGIGPSPYNYPFLTKLPSIWTRICLCRLSFSLKGNSPTGNRPFIYGYSFPCVAPFTGIHGSNCWIL